jgi:ribosomal protein S18 acetylase RimI-like enzyme
MKVILRRPTEADAKHAASLLTELGYPSTQADARDRLVRSLRSATSYCLVAESAAEVVGLISAELVFYFPTGSTICRITSLVVSSQHRGHGLAMLLDDDVVADRRPRPVPSPVGLVVRRARIPDAPRCTALSKFHDVRSYANPTFHAMARSISAIGLKGE